VKIRKDDKMTNNEAVELENTCDELMTKAISEECNVSMAMTGRLKVNFGDNYFSLNSDYANASYVKFHGDYFGLLNVIEMACCCISENKELFDKLIWSYENRSKLEK